MFFFRNKHIMIDLGTGNNNKINWAIEDKQEFIDIVGKLSTHLLEHTLIYRMNSYTMGHRLGWYTRVTTLVLKCVDFDKL